MIATLILTSLLSIPRASLASAEGPIAAGPAGAPRSGSSLVAAMADVSRDSHLEVRLADAPPLDVQFIRYDAAREVLVYRQRNAGGLRDVVGEVRHDRIDEIQVFDRRTSSGAAAGGMLIGLVTGLAAGVAFGSRADDFHTLAGEAGLGITGMCLGSIVGYVIGSAAGSREDRGPVVWERPDR